LNTIKPFSGHGTRSLKKSHKTFTRGVPLGTWTSKFWVCRTSSWPKRLREPKLQLSRSYGLGCRRGKTILRSTATAPAARDRRKFFFAQIMFHLYHLYVYTFVRLHVCTDVCNHSWVECFCPPKKRFACPKNGLACLKKVFACLNKVKMHAQ
jgi:hypothetical protein